jgi:hypothetical protein
MEWKRIRNGFYLPSSQSNPGYLLAVEEVQVKMAVIHRDNWPVNEKDSSSLNFIFRFS